MKHTVLLLAVACACGAFAIDYPIIAVETDSGTLDAPLRLDDMNVSYVADEGASPETVTFASLGQPTSGTLRKRGSGFVMSSTNMICFTGTVLVEEGAMCCESKGSFGPANNTAGPLVVSNGASLVIAATTDTAVEYGLNIWNKITIEGTGVDGIGAIFNKTSGARSLSRQAIKGGIALAGDALIGSVTESELGDYQTTDAYQLNGHTLTLSGGNGMLMGGATIQSGNIVISNGNLRIQGEFTLESDDSNELRLCDGGSITTYNGTSFSSPWKLVLEDESKLYPGGDSAAGTIDNLNRHQWIGPVQVSGTTSLSGSENEEGFSLLGPVIGDGGFSIIRGYLNLTNEQNAFTGPIRVRPTSTSKKATLGLWNRNAWPQANENPIAVTNGSVYFGAKTDYNLPKILWYKGSSYALSEMDGEPTFLQTPGIVKTGAGELSIPGQLTATNRTELRAGTLRLASPTAWSKNPGVWEGMINTNLGYKASKVTSYYSGAGAMPYTNGVASSLYYCQKTGKPDWKYRQAARYEGYIWNRSGVTQNWSLAMAAIEGKCYIDDVLVIQQEMTWYYLATNTIAVAPGPHKFDIRFYNGKYGEGGAKAAYRIQDCFGGSEGTGEAKTIVDPTTGETVYEPLDPEWPKDFGFGIDVQGRSSLSSDDYVKPMNGEIANSDGGDGAWFTLTTNSFVQEMAQEIEDGSLASSHQCSSFATLAAWSGTTLDIGGGVACVTNFEGFTHVVNGALRIAGVWTLDAAAANGGAKLVADAGGKVVFGPDAVIDVDDPSTWRPHAEFKVIVESESIEGEPSLSPTLAERGARLIKDGGTLSLAIPGNGSTFIIR